MLTRSGRTRAGSAAVKTVATAVANSVQSLDAFAFQAKAPGRSSRARRGAARHRSTVRAVPAMKPDPGAPMAVPRPRLRTRGPVAPVKLEYEGMGREGAAGAGAGAGARAGTVGASRRFSSSSTRGVTSAAAAKASATSMSLKRARAGDDGNTTDERGASHGKRPPDGWEVIYENVREMRAARDAPVDSMGAEVLPDASASRPVFRYQTLISLMLSSQTKDHITAAAMRKLQEHGLTPENIARTSQDEVGKLIYPVGFWRRKSQYIKETTDKLLAEYGGDIPETVKGLVSLKGVGPKMAHLVMTIAWNKTCGIGVDVHVHRICNRLRWVRTKNPEATRKALEEWLPQSHWAEINLLFVGFGQQICKPVNPSCGDCTNKSLCPVGRRWTPRPVSPAKSRRGAPAKSKSTKSTTA